MKSPPSGIEIIRQAVHQLDALEMKLSGQEGVVAQRRVELGDAECALAKIRTEYAEAERRLADLITGGRCAHHHAEPPSSTPLPVASLQRPIVALDDESVPIIWRIACMLLTDPILDYQSTALRVWGPSNKKTAKNRVNAHVQHLRRLGVLRTLGSNRFEVDRAKLAELSGLSVGDDDAG